MIIDTAEYTCAGGREINEDACFRGDGVFIVADGLGGHDDGEEASACAVEFFRENCHGGYSDEKITELLCGADNAVRSLESDSRTTVAAVFAENNTIRFSNVGDSRVYYFRNNRVFAQTKDHSVCQASVDMGVIKSEDIRESEDRSRLLKVLGGENSLVVKKHYPPVEAHDGDAFLICSDGFWEYVYEAEMEADLLKSENAQTWLRHMLKRHLLRAENGGDNYTAICGIISSPLKNEEKKSVRCRPVFVAAGVLVLIVVAIFILNLIFPQFSDYTVFHIDTTSVTESATDSSQTEPTETEPTETEPTQTEITETSEEQEIVTSAPETDEAVTFVPTESDTESSQTASSQTDVTETSAASETSLSETSAEIITVTDVSESMTAASVTQPEATDTSSDESSAFIEITKISEPPSSSSVSINAE